MTFLKKIWKNRVCTYPGRRKLTAAGEENVYDVTREEGVVAEEGDAFCQTTMNDLESRIAAGFADSMGGQGRKTSGNCDEMWESGFYECSSAVENLPIEEEGILEVYCSIGTALQKWVSESGIWVRWSPDQSQWGEWRRVHDSASQPTVTVSETEPENPAVNDLWAW